MSMQMLSDEIRYLLLKEKNFPSRVFCTLKNEKKKGKGLENSCILLES